MVLFVYREEYYLKNKEPQARHRRALQVADRDGAGARPRRGHHRQAAPRPHRHGAARTSTPRSPASPTWRARMRCRSASDPARTADCPPPRGTHGQELDDLRCQSCGAVYGRWQGRCDACGAWNTIAEEAAAAPLPGGRRRPRARGKGRVFPLEPLTGGGQEAPRVASGIAELDRVTGGGFVTGSVILLGGDPGIGKSTLLMQACAALAATATPRRLHLRRGGRPGRCGCAPQRLGLSDAPVELAAETSVEDILATLSQGPPPGLVVIEFDPDHVDRAGRGAPGTVTQVRGSAQSLIRYAKTSGAPLILVGHVTKDGQIAGPRVVEHMVDAVHLFRGRRRAPVPHPARGEEPLRPDRRDRRLRDDRARAWPRSPTPPRCSWPGATRPSSGHGGLRRHGGHAAAAGRDPGAGRADRARHAAARRRGLGPEPAWRWCIAVLEAHAGLELGQHDVYLNVAGGLRITEPAADVAAAAALVSSLSGAPLPPDRVYFGEIGLTGALRPVGQARGAAQGGRKARLRTRLCCRARGSRAPASPPDSAGRRRPTWPTSWPQVAATAGGRRPAAEQRPMTQGDACVYMSGRQGRHRRDPPNRRDPMSHLPVTALDLVVLGVVLISALLAAVRGFTREVLAIASWVAAAAAAYVLHPDGAALRQGVHPERAARAGRRPSRAVFLGTLIIVSFITVKISDLILDSQIGALDRTLGFLFGAARGLLIAVIAFVFFDRLVGEKQQPEWVRDAKLRPRAQGDRRPDHRAPARRSGGHDRQVEGAQAHGRRAGRPRRAAGRARRPGPARRPRRPRPTRRSRPRRASGTQTATGRRQALSSNLVDNAAPVIHPRNVELPSPGGPYGARHEHDLTAVRPPRRRSDADFDWMPTRCARSAASSASSATPTPRPSPRSACTRCSIAARRRRASSPSTGGASTPNGHSASSATTSPTPRSSTGCTGTRAIGHTATPPPARRSCATCSRSSPSSTAAASPSPTTATSPTR